MIKSLLQSYSGGMYTAEETASLLAAPAPFTLFPTSRTIFGVVLCQLLEKTSIGFSSIGKETFDKVKVYEMTVHEISILSLVPQY